MWVEKTTVGRGCCGETAYTLQRSASTDIFCFAIAVVMSTLTESSAAKVKTQYRIAKMLQRLHGVEHYFVVQCAAVKRMRMAYKRCMRRMLRTLIEQGFQSSRWSFEE